MKMEKEPDDRTGVGLDHWGVKFPETQWSALVPREACGKPSSSTSDAGFSQLCSRYWYPLYAFLRKRGHSSEDAQDLTQGFFAHLMRGERFGKLDPTRGRFRAYLLSSLKHYVADEKKKQNAAKRGGGSHQISIEQEMAEDRFHNEPYHELTPDKLFDRQWAMTILTETENQLAREFANLGNEDTFSEIHKYLLTKPDQGDYEQIALRLGILESSVRTSVSRMRKRHISILREQVRATVTSAGEIDDEIRYLLAALGRNPA